MTLFTAFLGFFLLTIGLAVLLAKPEDKRWAASIIAIAWIGLFPLLAFINLIFPFAGGGDDEGYFSVAATNFNTWSDVVDLSQFVGLMEQPGYPWLLALLFQLTGEDLLAFKLLNLAAFILLIPIWYRIGLELDSRQFGRAMAVAILLLTPLWCYWMFLLKDLVITLLQSIFVLGLVFISGSRSKAGWALVLSATLGLIPFRAPLVLLNVVVLAGTVLLILVRRGQQGRSFVTAIIAGIVIAGITSIASDPEWMAILGVYSQDRMIGTEAADASVSQIGETSLMNRGLFPFLYLFSETSGFNLKTWSDFDAFSLRGSLAVPWILVVVPFYMLGLLWLMRRNFEIVQTGGIMQGIRSTRLVATPWGAVLMFILSYVALSWTVGDTTRWRIPDMPAIAAVAMAGWFSMTRPNRRRILMGWIGFVGVAVILFNVVRGV